MANKRDSKISQETQHEADRLANAMQRPGQSKEQKRLVAQGIAKGIAEYKKQHKAKMRQLDKKRKQPVDSESRQNTGSQLDNTSENTQLPIWLVVWCCFSSVAFFVSMSYHFIF